jgi:hypothetical protein
VQQATIQVIGRQRAQLRQRLQGAISTRRFCARPGASAFDATGCSGPKAAANTDDDGRPSSISARVTVSARWADSSQVVGELPVAVAHRAVVGEAADHQQFVAPCR